MSCFGVEHFGFRSICPSDSVRLRAVSRRFFCTVHTVGIRIEIVDLRYAHLGDASLSGIVLLIKAGRACRCLILGDFRQCLDTMAVEVAAKCASTHLSPLAARHAPQVTAASRPLQSASIVEVHSASEILPCLGKACFRSVFIACRTAKPYLHPRFSGKFAVTLTEQTSVLETLTF